MRPLATISRRDLLSAPLWVGFSVSQAIAGTAEDQTAEVQAAIDEAQVAGGMVDLVAGTYLVSELKITGTVTLRGVPGGTILKSMHGGNILSIADADAVTLEGVSFSSKGTAGDLVSVENVKRLVVETCAFAGAGSGLVMQACGGRVVGNSFAFHQARGVFSQDAVGLEISGNTISDIGNNGIQVWRSATGEDGTRISNNHIARIAAQDGGSGQNGNGINVFRAGNVIVANNRISDCAFTAVRNNSGSNCVVTGNSIFRCNEVAIYCEFGFQGAVVSDNLIEDVAFGISITNYNDGGRLAVCSGNVVRGAKGGHAFEKTPGVGIHAEADTVVSNNVVEDAVDVGINMGWGEYARNLSATGNIIRNCGRGIGVSVAAGAGDILLANNMIAGSRSLGIAGMDHDVVKTTELGSAGAALPPNLTLNGNVVRN